MRCCALYNNVSDKMYVNVQEDAEEEDEEEEEGEGLIMEGASAEDFAEHVANKIQKYGYCCVLDYLFFFLDVLFQANGKEPII